MRTSNIKLTFVDLIKCYGTVLEQQSPHQRLVSVVFYWQLGIKATCHVCEVVVKNIHFCLIVSALLLDICIFCWTNFDLTWKYRIKAGVGSKKKKKKKKIIVDFPDWFAYSKIFIFRNKFKKCVTETCCFKSDVTYCLCLDNNA